MDRIAITGMGVLSPAGRSLQAFWDTLCRARSVYGTIPSFADDAQYRVKIGAQIADDDIDEATVRQFPGMRGLTWSL